MLAQDNIGIFIDHNVMDFCDYAYVLYQGRILARSLRKWVVHDVLNRTWP